MCTALPMSVSGYHGIDTKHVMNVDQYPATHTMQTTNSRWFEAQVIFQILIQAKPLFKQFKLWQGFAVVYLGIGPKPLKIWAWVHFLFLFWRQKWKVLSLWCVFPCYLSYPRSGQTDVLHELLASWQPPSPLVSPHHRWSIAVFMSHVYAHLQQNLS